MTSGPDVPMMTSLPAVPTIVAGSPPHVGVPVAAWPIVVVRLKANTATARTRVRFESELLGLLNDISRPSCLTRFTASYLVFTRTDWPFVTSFLTAYEYVCQHHNGRLNTPTGLQCKYVVCGNSPLAH